MLKIKLFEMWTSICSIIGLPCAPKDYSSTERFHGTLSEALLVSQKVGEVSKDTINPFPPPLYHTAELEQSG